MSVFIVFATVIFALLTVVWKSSDLLNTVLKFVFFVGTGWGCILIAQVYRLF